MANGIGRKIKDFFIEEENSYDSLVGDINLEENLNLEYEDISSQEFTNTGTNVTNVSSIEDIYRIAKLNDMSKSVYKVEEIKSVLPNTLPTTAKKESVLGMMKVSNLTTEDVKEDTKNRKNVLNSVLENFTNDTLELTDESSNEIKHLEDRINELKEAINKRNIEQEQQEKLIQDELRKIDSIIEFIL